MLDKRIRKLIDPPLERVADTLLAWGLTANRVTVGGFILGAGACLSIAFQQYLLGAGLLALNRIADGVDGTIARKTQPTDVGGFLDIVLDFLVYSGVPFAFAVAQPSSALPAAFLIYSFVGTGSSFLAFATITAQRGVSIEQLGKKGLYYSAGLIEGTESIVFLIACCLWPDFFAVFAWIFGALCWLTTVARIGVGVQTFRVPRP